MSQLHPNVSANFGEAAALDWLNAVSESNAVLSAILAVIHPTLYDAGRQTTERLSGSPNICPPDILDRWASVFSGVAVISNRSSPSHRDGGSRYNWYDVLVTLGRYQNCGLTLPGLGITLEYGPGTVVGISGMMIEHAVPDVEGDRLCYAYFMRNNVHEWANAPASDWMSTKYFSSAECRWAQK